MTTAHRRTLAALMGGLAILVLGSAPAWAAAGGDPAGNNGTVKIDGRPFDDAPDNEPHPGCVFQVDFYGFDAGDLNASVTFEAVAPTAGGTLLTDEVPIGEDSHAGGGSERGLDASRTYDLTGQLSGIAPQRNQGWHVRLTVHADGSQGADVKHKVFWVDGCDTAGEVAAGNETAGNDTSGTGTSTSETTGATSPVTGTNGVSGSASVPAVPVLGAATLPASVLGTELIASPAAVPAETEQPAEVLGETVTRAPASPTGPSVLARTGVGIGLAVLALALIAGGGLLVRLRSAFLTR